MKDSSIDSKGADKSKPKKKGEIPKMENSLREMKKMDRASAKQRQFNNDILDTIPEGIAYTTLKGKIIFINRALEHLLEIPKKDLIGKRIPEVIISLLDPSEHEHLTDKFKILISGIKVKPFQVKYKNKILEINPNISLRTRRLTATIRDVTKSIEIYKALTKNESDLSRLFNISIQLLESIEKKSLIQKIADQAANLVGTDTSAIYLIKDDNLVLEATSPPLPENFPDEFRLAKLDNHPHIRKVTETGTTYAVSDCEKGKWTAEEKEIVNARNLGSLVYIPLFIQKKAAGVIILGTISRTHKYDKHEISLFTIYSNITSLALENSYLFENLLTTKEKAEESNNLKSAFLHNISHEIRTPLNAIVGFSDLIGDENISNSTRKEYSNIILQCNNQLLAIIDDILNISQIEAKQISLCETDTDVGVILRNIYNQFRVEASRKGINFTINSALQDEDLIIYTDEQKIIGIITNLVSNAIKFTDKGSIELGCCLMNNNKIDFYVSDTGIGIPPEEQQKIFERFYQVDCFSTRTYGGMGLGLAICAAYTELLGGELVLNSVPGKGSKFTLSIPLKRAKKQVLQRKSLKRISDHAKTILIAEDDDTNYFFIHEIISKLGYKAIRAVNGNDAIKVCSANQIDLVLMDVRMPVMNGYDSAREILKIKPHTPIIMQTAYGYDKDWALAMENGRIDLITKPFSTRQLTYIVEKTLKRSDL